MKYELKAVYSRKDKSWRVTSGLAYFGGFKSKDEENGFIEKINEPKTKKGKKK